MANRSGTPQCSTIRPSTTRARSNTVMSTGLLLGGPKNGPVAVPRARTRTQILSSCSAESSIQLRLGDRHPAGHRHRDDPHSPFPPRSRRFDARCGGRLAGWKTVVRRQRRQQLRGRDRHQPRRRRSQVKGFIPTGWYPTAVAVTPDGRNLLVGRGQGEPDQAESRQRRRDEAQDRIRSRRPASDPSLPLHWHDTFRGRCRSCPFPTTRRSPVTSRRSTRIAPIRTSF